jgi:hypothetical protein
VSLFIGENGTKTLNGDRRFASEKEMSNGGGLLL